MRSIAVVLALLLAGCSADQQDTAKAGASGAGGSAGQAGTAGAGGTAGSGGTGAEGGTSGAGGTSATGGTAGSGGTAGAGGTGGAPTWDYSSCQPQGAATCADQHPICCGERGPAYEAHNAGLTCSSYTDSCGGTEPCSTCGDPAECLPVPGDEHGRSACFEHCSIVDCDPMFCDATSSLCWSCPYLPSQNGSSVWGIANLPSTCSPTGDDGTREFWCCQLHDPAELGHPDGRGTESLWHRFKRPVRRVEPGFRETLRVGERIAAVCAERRCAVDRCVERV